MIAAVLIVGALILIAVFDASRSRCSICYKGFAIFPSDNRVDPTKRCWTHYQIPKKAK